MNELSQIDANTTQMVWSPFISCSTILLVVAMYLIFLSTLFIELFCRIRNRFSRADLWLARHSNERGGGSNEISLLSFKYEYFISIQSDTSIIPVVDGLFRILFALASLILLCLHLIFSFSFFFQILLSNRILRSPEQCV